MTHRRLPLLVVLLAIAAPCCADQAPAAEMFDAGALEADRVLRQENLRRAARALEDALAADPAVRATWHDFLDWHSWGAPLIADDAIDPAAVRQLSWRLYRPDPGFETPQIGALRDALSAYLAHDAAVREAAGDLPGEFQRRLAALTSAMRASEDAAAPLDYAKLESAAWWLAATGQAPGALAAARSRFNQPQVVFQFHRELIEDKLAQFQNETREQRPTRNRIQGTLVTGTATVQSLTTAQLSAAGSPDVRLQIMTRGTVAAPHNVANSGRVRVASSASSEFTVSAEIYFDGQKFAATAPLAQADTSTRIKSVAAPRIIRRAAARRAQASRAGAESEGASLIEREAVASMEKRLATAVEKLNAKAAGFLNFMRRIGNWPAQPWVTQLTSTAVQVGHHPRSIAGLGALPHQMPPFSGQETLGLSFHDGGLEGILTPQVAGKVWTDVNFAMLQRELTGGNTEEFMIGLDPGRWSAQWAWHAPVRIHFTAHHASIRYRFDAVEIDGAKYEAPFEVHARVTLSAPPLGFEMHMLEPAAVASLDPGNPLPPHFQAFLERKFRGLFGMHFSLDGMQFPAGGALDGMSAFRVAAIHLEPNWVHLRYTNRKPQATLVRGETAPSPAEARP